MADTSESTGAVFGGIAFPIFPIDPAMAWRVDDRLTCPPSTTNQTRLVRPIPLKLGVPTLVSLPAAPSSASPEPTTLQAAQAQLAAAREQLKAGQPTSLRATRRAVRKAGDNKEDQMLEAAIRRAEEERAAATDGAQSPCILPPMCRP